MQLAPLNIGPGLRRDYSRRCCGLTKAMDGDAREVGRQAYLLDMVSGRGKSVSEASENVIFGVGFGMRSG